MSRLFDAIITKISQVRVFCLKLYTLLLRATKVDREPPGDNFMHLTEQFFFISIKMLDHYWNSSLDHTTRSQKFDEKN